MHIPTNLFTQLTIACLLLLPALLPAAESDSLFQTTQIFDIEIVFPYVDFLDTLYEHRPEETYVSCSVTCNGVSLDSVGIRFKGNSSFWGHPGDKKPLKLKFNKYDENQRFFGLQKINLSNGFQDATFLREKLTYDFIGQFLPSPRANFARVHLNGEYWGFYTLVEQVDKPFIEDRFGNGEDGNLFKGDPHGHLTWLGNDPEPYWEHYELKTNEGENDWSDLIQFIDVLNNTPDEDLNTALPELFLDGNWRHFLAMNTLFVNLDSYQGSGHNYYLYHRDDNNRFIHIPWDLNESFGGFNMGMGVYQLIHMPIDFLPLNFPGGSERPLTLRTYELPEFRSWYEGHLADLAENHFTEAYFFPQIDALADLIRADVYADTRKQFSNEEFEFNIEHHMGPFPGLKPFIAQRRQSVISQVGGAQERPPLVLNEFMADNETIMADEMGEFEDWVEIHFTGDADFNLGGCYLTDDLTDLSKWMFPDTLIDDEVWLLIWLDNDAEQGPLHATFKLGSGGEELALVDSDGATIIDSIVFGTQREDVSLGRFPDSDGEWVQYGNCTPGARNEEAPVNLSPFIDVVTQDPLFPTAVDEVSIATTITDDSIVTAATVNYRGEGDWMQAGMTSGANDLWTGAIPPFSTGTTVQWYLTAVDDSSATVFWPAGAPGETEEYLVQEDPCACPLLINEFLASNDTVLPDEFGEFDDWVELYNHTDCPVNLNGIYLTDDLANPTQYRLELEADSLLQPEEFAIIWCDDDSEQGPFHTDFKLSGGGEQIGVLFADGITWADSLTYSEQTTDISEGRCPDGEAAWQFFTAPTPGTFNCGDIMEPVEDLSISIESNTVYIFWTAVDNATQYNIYRANEPYGPFVYIDSTTSANWSEPVNESNCFYQVTTE